jgi:predicted dehydrogenase
MISRLLIVGSGSIGKRHFDVVRTLYPSVDIKFLSRPPQNDQLKISGHIYAWDDVDKFNPDIAVIANPAPFHAQLGINLAKRGVHLLVEKPISDNSDDASLLAHECRKNNVLLQVGYNLRYLSSLKSFRKLIISGNIIGDLISIRSEVGQYLPHWRNNVDYRNTVSARKELGGGVLLELSHEIDYLNWIFGVPETVFGFIGKQSNLEINVEDSADLLIRYPLGKIKKKYLVANLSMDFIRSNPVRQCTVIGSTGSIRWDGIANIVEVYESNMSTWSTIYEGKDSVSDTYFSQMEDFMSRVIRSAYHDNYSADSIRVLRLIEAARESNILGVMRPINYN